MVVRATIGAVVGGKITGAVVTGSAVVAAIHTVHLLWFNATIFVCNVFC